MGRQRALLLSSLLFVVGAGCMVMPFGGLALLLVGRCTVGIGMGKPRGLPLSLPA